jgi:hypothetical protein
MNTDSRWTRALEHLSAAFQEVESLSGAATAPFGNSSVLEVRHELAYMIRRVANLALLGSRVPIRPARRPNPRWGGKTK